MTFYPTQPRKYRRSRASSSVAEMNASFSSNMGMGIGPEFNASMLSYSSSIMGASASTRPLPSSPVKSDGSKLDEPIPDALKQSQLQHNASVRSHADSISGFSKSSSPIPSGQGHLQSSMSPVAPLYRHPIHDAFNMNSLTNSLPNGIFSHRNSLAMSLATTDAQIAQEIHLPAIPPEPPQHLSSSTMSTETLSTMINHSQPQATAAQESTDDPDEEFINFFNQSIDSMHPDQPGASSTVNSKPEGQKFFSSIASVGRPKSSTPNQWSSNRPSPLSQSTSSHRSIDTLQPLSPTTPQSSSFGGSYNNSPNPLSRSAGSGAGSLNTSHGSTHLKAPALASYGGYGSYSTPALVIPHSDDDGLSRNQGKRSIKRKPISNSSSSSLDRSGSFENFASNDSGSSYNGRILPYPGATHTTDPAAPALDDDRDIRQVPFSADAYFSRKAGLMAPPSPPKDSAREHPHEFDDRYNAMSKVPELSYSTTGRQLPPSPPMKSVGIDGNGAYDDSYGRLNLKVPVPHLARAPTNMNPPAIPAPPAHRDPLSESVSSMPTVINNNPHLRGSNALPKLRGSSPAFESRSSIPVIPDHGLASSQYCGRNNFGYEYADEYSDDYEDEYGNQFNNGRNFNENMYAHNDNWN